MTKNDSNKKLAELKEQYKFMEEECKAASRLLKEALEELDPEYKDDYINEALERLNEITKEFDE